MLKGRKHIILKKIGLRVEYDRYETPWGVTTGDRDWPVAAPRLTTNAREGEAACELRKVRHSGKVMDDCGVAVEGWKNVPVEAGDSTQPV